MLHTIVRYLDLHNILVLEVLLQCSAACHDRGKLYIAHHGSWIIELRYERLIDHLLVGKVSE